MIDERAVRRLYLSGQSGLVIARCFGTSKHTIYRLLTKMKVSKRRVGRQSIALQPAKPAKKDAPLKGASRTSRKAGAAKPYPPSDSV